MSLRSATVLLGLSILAAGAAGQDPSRTAGTGYSETRIDGDEVEATITGGLWYGASGRQFRCESAVLRLDRDEFKRLLDPAEKGLPRRGTVLPDARRGLSADLIAKRLGHFVTSLGSPRPATDEHRDMMRLFRSIYVEGRIVVVDGDTEVLTADSISFSVPDDRAVMKNVEMRLVSNPATGGSRVLVLRAPRLVKQGIRTTGRGVSLTTCSAGRPHYEVRSAEIEIIERGHEFEIFSRGNRLVFSGGPTVPLPNAHFYTSEQSDVILRGVNGRYSSNQGYQLGVDLGGSMNDAGGWLHNLVTGRPDGEFRGEWRVGLGYIETRGNPIDAELEYSAGDLYAGRTSLFYMDSDRGPNRSFLASDIDGSLITESQRRMVRTENRFRPGGGWSVDLTAFAASDPNVVPEFYLNTYQDAENPETSVHVRHADENRLFTLTGRTNLASFSYADDRSIAPAFRSERPLATYDVFSEPLFPVGDADVVLTSSTSAGLLKHEFHPRFGMPVADETFRFDQEFEIAAPFMLGPVAVRPRTSARFTYYDESVLRTEQERWAFDAGVSFTTRLARTFDATGAGGEPARIRHEIYPTVSVGHLFQVDGQPSELFQFDEVDSLNENGTIRVGLLNRLQSTTGGRQPTYRNPFEVREHYGEEAWPPVNQQQLRSREFLWVDLAQNFFPIAGRDNDGDVLGIAEYEVIWRPQPTWIPVDNLSFLFEGEHDWNNSRARTFNSLVRFGPLAGINWYGGYRTDYLVDGQLLYALSTNLLGRWTLIGSGAFDLQNDEQLYYSTMLVRRDHDWVITIGLNFDVIQNDTTFRVDFEPLFGGISRRRAVEFAGMSGRGSDAILNY